MCIGESTYSSLLVANISGFSVTLVACEAHLPRYTFALMMNLQPPSWDCPREVSGVKIGNMDFDRLLQLFRLLYEHDVEYVLVGGVAMNVHGLVRGTDDMDLFVRPTSENVARLRSALRLMWDDPEIDGIKAEDLAGDYPTVRYGPPTDELVIDLISRLGTAFRYDDLESVVVDLQGVPIRVATPETLFRMKRDTIRDDDRRDAQRLQERFGIEDP